MTKERQDAGKNYLSEVELRIEEATGSRSTTVRLEGVSFATPPPRVGERIKIQEQTFKVIDVSHVFSGSPLKHLIVVTVEKPQPTAAE